MVGSFLDQSLTEVDSCDKFPFTNKYRQEYRYGRSAEINSLVVTIHRDWHRIVCSYKYWIKTSIRQNTGLHLHRECVGIERLLQKSTPASRPDLVCLKI